MLTILLFLLALVAVFGLPRMSDATAVVPLKTDPQAGRGAYPIADGVTLYPGQFVQLEGGYLNHWDETGKFLGFLLDGEDRARDGVLIGETSDTPPPEGQVNEEGAILTHRTIGGSPAQSKVGDLVYCADSDPANMTMTDTTNPPVGWLKRYRSSTDVDVQLFSADAWQATKAAAGWES